MPGDARHLYHLVQGQLWRAARDAGEPYYPPTYKQDRFIHLTGDPALLLSVGNHFYKDVPGEWLLLVLEAAKLTSQVIWEPAAAVGAKAAQKFEDRQQQEEEEAGAQREEQQQQQQQQQQGPLFPHLYGTIDYEAVVGELTVARDPHTGEFLSIPGLVN